MQHTMEKLFEDELVKELLDDESPFFMVHQTKESSSNITVNSPLVYSGPTVQDIESALSYVEYGISNENTSVANR